MCADILFGPELCSLWRLNWICKHVQPKLDSALLICSCIRWSRGEWWIQLHTKELAGGEFDRSVIVVDVRTVDPHEMNTIRDTDRFDQYLTVIGRFLL